MFQLPIIKTIVYEGYQLFSSKLFSLNAGSVPIFCQMEDSEIVDQIIKEGNLRILYGEFPKAMNLYEESKSYKIKGVLLETLGISTHV